jgi:hypothetical protein
MVRARAPSFLEQTMASNQYDPADVIANVGTQRNLLALSLLDDPFSAVNNFLLALE